MSESKTQYFDLYRERMAADTALTPDVKVLFICCLNAIQDLFQNDRSVYRQGEPAGPGRSQVGAPNTMRYRRVDPLCKFQPGTFYRFTIHFDYAEKRIIFQCHGYKLDPSPHLDLNADITPANVQFFIRTHLDNLDNRIYREREGPDES